jgi:hypothetical protein
MVKEANEENLKNEVIALLTEGKDALKETKKVLFDKTTKQYSLKIPKNISEGARLDSETEFEMIINPSQRDIDNAIDSHFIIYAKRKTNPKNN